MKRKCKICGNRFETPYLNRVWCSNECQREYAQKRYEKAKEKTKTYKKPVAKTKIKAKSESERAILLRKLVQVFNAYIRRRDENQPCISCGTTKAEEWHAGHYKTAKAHPELRFNEYNVNRQCGHCNVVLSGNIEGYRKGIIARYGQAVLDELEGYHPTLKLSVFEMKSLIEDYSK